ncbi:MAG: hypothetical protein N2508_00710, partial [Anaerolineae bacterium]|nr:hypothetical protein [Anaerolineae bacterium]
MRAKPAGTVYGLLCGLFFALFTWGYDALVLALNNADMAWVKLALGLPTALLIGGIVGRVAAGVPAFSPLLWTVAGALLGAVAAYIRVNGQNLVMQLADGSFRGEAVLALGEMATTRTLLVLFTSIALGTAAGFLERTALRRTKDRIKGMLSLVYICIPLAFCMGRPIDELLHRPWRLPVQTTARLVRQVMADAIPSAAGADSGYRALLPFREELQEQYTVHFVDFGADAEGQPLAYVDIAFDELVLRCAVADKRLLYCDDLTVQLRDWMDALVRAGLYLSLIH